MESPLPSPSISPSPSPFVPFPFPSPSPSPFLPFPSPSPSPSPSPGCPDVSSDENLGLGFLAAAIAIFFFGTNYIPVKKFDPGDGMFFQWVMGAGIFIVGFVTTCIKHGSDGSIPFYPLTLIGGALWATGNVMSVTVIKLIGLGMGVLVWGLANLAVGWLTGTFGLFGTPAEPVGIPILNYVGFSMALVSMVIFGLVEPATESAGDAESSSLIIQKSYDSADLMEAESYDGTKGKLESGGGGEDMLSVGADEIEILGGGDTFNRPPDSGIDTEGMIESVFGEHKRYVGFAMALLMGVMYGSAFTPSNHTIALCLPGHSVNGIDYVFSQFCGIFLTCTIWFLLYVAATKNRPMVNPQIVVPALVSGMMWGIAQVFFFVANSQLGLNVSFPLVALGPGIVAAVIGIVVYGEIQGKRNLLVFGVAFACSVLAISMITMSKLLGNTES